MSDKTLSLMALLTLLLVQCYLPIDTLAKQPWLREQPPCKSTQEVLSKLRVAGKLPVASGQVLIAGNVRLPQSLPLRMPMTITMAVAMAGGVREGSSRRIYLIRQSPERESKTETVIDLREIRRGRAPDVKLTGGEIVYVPESCAPVKPNRPTDPVRTITPSVAESLFDPDAAPNNSFNRTRLEASFHHLIIRWLCGFRSPVNSSVGRLTACIPPNQKVYSPRKGVDFMVTREEVIAEIQKVPETTGNLPATLSLDSTS